MWATLPKQHGEVVFKLKIAVEKFQSAPFIQLILIEIPEVKLDIIYQLVHVGQCEDLLKTHLGKDEINAQNTTYNAIITLICMCVCVCAGSVCLGYLPQKPTQTHYPACT